MYKEPYEIEAENNNTAFDELVRAINNRLVFAFIGAGCSKRNGCEYPGWKELISLLETSVKAKDPSKDLKPYQNLSNDKNDLLWYADYLKTEYLTDEEFFTIIRTHYQPKKIEDWSFHQELLRINFRHFLTTNYDALIENTPQLDPRPLDYFSWNNKAKLKEFYESINDPTKLEGRCVFHVHGRYDDQRSIILTEKDYMDMYFKDELSVKILWSIISAYRMCFIGFGMKDLEVLTVFRKVWWDFGRGGSKHFAFIHENDLVKRYVLRQYMRSKYGIEPIFYNVRTEQQDPHGELNDFIKRLAANQPIKSISTRDVERVDEIMDVNINE